MLISKEVINQIDVYRVDKNIPDDKMQTFANTHVTPNQIDIIIKNDADVYNENGELLLRFRKNKLPKTNIDAFYENAMVFATNTTNNRGSATGSKKKNVKHNPKIMTNITGYFDTFSPSQKKIISDRGLKLLNIRATRFTMEHPIEFKKMVPLLQNIDMQYKKIVPDKYKLQRKKANQTHFRVPNTAFTTITTNVNFQTAIHKDTGDDVDGFGNLVAIEHGKYKGGETCFPQYGIGVDVRTGDVLFMNVHEWHGNLPIKPEGDAKRLSVVCYLRTGVWEKTKNKSKAFMIKHINTVKNLAKHNVTRKNKL